MRLVRALFRLANSFDPTLWWEDEHSEYGCKL